MTLKELLEKAQADKLAALKANELSDLLAELREGFATAKEQSESDDDVATLKLVTDAVVQVKDRIREIKAEEAARENAIAELDKLVAEDEDEGAAESDATGDEGEGDATGEAEAETEAGAETEEKVLVQASGLGGIQIRRPQESKFTPDAPAQTKLGSSPMRATYNPGGVVSPNEIYTNETLSKTIERTVEAMRTSGVPEGGHTIGMMTEATHAGELVLQASHEGLSSSELAEMAIEKNLTATYDAYNEVLQASGGVCAPSQIDYMINVIGGVDACISNQIPTIRTNRPMSIFEDIVLDFTNILTDPRFAAGIGVVTASQDALGYASSDPAGPTPDKGCVHVDCPSPVDCAEMRAIYQCLTIGEFQSRNFPEYVDAFRRMLDLAYKFKKEQTILDDIVTAAGAPIPLNPATFGSVRDILPAIRNIITRADGVSGTRGNWRVWVPRHLKVQLANDILRTAFSITSNEPLPMSISKGLATLAVDEGIMVGEYCASAGLTTQGDPTFVTAPVKGAPLEPLPPSTRIIIAREGFAFRQSQGELRVGLRESLVKTNDFGTFVEGFESTCFRNTTNLYLLDVAHCDNGLSGGSVVASC